MFMTKRLVASSLFFAAVFAGCSRRDTPASSPQPTAERRDAGSVQPLASAHAAAIDACKLVSYEEIASIQGEAPARTQLLGESDGQLSVSQCNFLLPTGPKSLAVRVVERGKGPNARDPKEVWQETFHEGAPEVANVRGARQPQKVDGAGEEAFWLGDVKSGGLHVLQGNRYIRISVGGHEDLQTKVAKCSKLSKFVLPRLKAEH